MGDTQKPSDSEARFPRENVSEQQPVGGRGGVGDVPDSVQPNEGSGSKGSADVSSAGKAPKRGGRSGRGRQTLNAQINLHASQSLSDDDDVTEEIDSFNNVLMREELTLHFSSLNKMRESLMLGMAKDVASGGDGMRYMKALKALRSELTFARTAAQGFLD